jgi:hypothetical protein
MALPVNTLNDGFSVQCSARSTSHLAGIALCRSGNSLKRRGQIVKLEVIMCLIMVLPNDSARISGDGVKSIVAPGVNHVGLLFSNHTARLVRQCLGEE